jgi:hypothetical protein
VQVGAGGTVEVDCSGMRAVAVSAHGRRRARVHGAPAARVPPAGARTAAGGRARIVRQQHQVAAVRECGRGSGLVMYKC